MTHNGVRVDKDVEMREAREYRITNRRGGRLCQFVVESE